ncbi:MAG TPA: T9SS type A sorting domain-containing protein, partial [Cytophagaceae bacterium]
LSDVKCGLYTGFSYRGLPTFPKSLVVSEPEILPGDGTYCTGEEIDLSYIFGGYVDPSTLVWKALGGGHTFTPGGATSTVPNPKISFSTTGAKQVIVEFQDACGRAYDDTINLTIIDPKIPAGSITCNSNYIALTATGTPSSDHPNYVWYDAAVGGNVLGTGSPVNLYYDNTHAPASVWVEVAENVSTTSSGTNRSIGASAAGFGWVGNIPSNYSVSGINILSDNFILKSFDIKPYNGGGTNCNNFEFTVEISNGSGVVFSKSYNSGTFTCGNAFKVDVFTQLPKGNNYTITLKNFTGNISYLYGGNWGGATNANEISYPAQGAGTCSIGNLVYDFANYSIETSCSQRVKIDRNCTLPVDFTYFNATPDNDKILLVWGTAWEVNNDYFDIQHSIDGENFTSVAKVKGQGSTNSPSQYMAYHTEPVNGINYYRIVQYDFDKQTTISQTIAVAFNSIETIQVRPNPSKDLFTIKVINGLEDATINVLDLLGRNLSSTVLTREVNEISIGESLEKGTYILQYVSKSGIQYIKVVKE